MKDAKHIRQDINSVAWVMPQGSDFGVLGAPRGSKKFFFKHGHEAFHARFGQIGQKLFKKILEMLT